MLNHKWKEVFNHYLLFLPWITRYSFSRFMVQHRSISHNPQPIKNPQFFAPNSTASPIRNETPPLTAVLTLSCSLAFGFITSAVSAVVTSRGGAICLFPIVLQRGSSGGLRSHCKLWGGTPTGPVQPGKSLLLLQRSFRPTVGLLQAVAGHAVHKLYGWRVSTWELTKLCGNSICVRVKIQPVQAGVCWRQLC